MSDPSITTSAGTDVTGRFRRLLIRSAIALLLCILLIAICYRFVDRPVAFFVADHAEFGKRYLVWATYISTVLLDAAPVVAILVAIRLAWPGVPRWQMIALAAAVSLMVSGAIAEGAKPVFGRTWPETWIDDNPSLIKDGAFGFHPLTAGSGYGSFPSGHTTAIMSVVSILWVAYPKTRVFGVAAVALVAVALVANNYHFVSDTIGGAFLGGICGAYVLAFLNRNTKEFE